MSLKDKITSDMTAAMKAKDPSRLSTLRMTKAAIMNEENKRGVGTVLTDDEILKVLQTLVKQRKDSFEQFSSSGRDELAEKEKAELAVLEEYLPQSATESEIETAVNDAIGKTDASSMRDMGAVMAAVKELLAGKTVNGKIASEMVKKKLSQ